MEKPWKAKYCPKCDPDTTLGVPPVLNYCSRCGDHLIELPEGPKCSRCGHYLTRGDEFCSYCGLAVKAVS